MAGKHGTRDRHVSTPLYYIRALCICRISCQKLYTIARSRFLSLFLSVCVFAIDFIRMRSASAVVLWRLLLARWCHSLYFAPPPFFFFFLSMAPGFVVFYFRCNVSSDKRMRRTSEKRHEWGRPSMLFCAEQEEGFTAAHKSPPPPFWQ